MKVGRASRLSAMRAAWGAAMVLCAGRAPAAPEEKPPHVVVDRAVVRFFAPEIGGAEQPRFVDERTLAFEARLEVIAERADGIGNGYDDRQVRAALDHHLSEEMLASLAGKLIAGSPPWQRPTKAELDRIRNSLGSALLQRLGGDGRVQAAASAEGLDASEVEALWQRQALAAWYIQRAMSPVLEPSEEQLREAFRTAAHPYRGQEFETVHDALRGWLVVERVRAAEAAFLQSARTRMRVIVLR